MVKALATRTYTRRTPEAAKALILDAATRVFATALPDQIGVREVAVEAGVSHGLITHYFGTYERLIDEVIERRVAAMRSLAFARLGSATFAPSESPLLDVLIELLEDRTLTRLVAWSLLAGHADRVMGGDGALGQIVDAMHARVSQLGAAVARDRLEMSVVMSISMVAGWSLAGPALERAAGRREPYSREQLRRELHRMMRAYVQAP